MQRSKGQKHRCCKKFAMPDQKQKHIYSKKFAIWDQTEKKSLLQNNKKTSMY